MKLRRLELIDAPGVAALWHAGAIESARTDPAFSPRISQEVYSTSVAGDLSEGAYLGWGVFSEAPQTLLAYLTARVTPASAEFNQLSFLYILDLDVHREARRIGLGTKLVSAARQFAQSEGLGGVEVSWLSADPTAKAFWQRQGFTQYIARARCPLPPSAK
jgi:GNAT superfamily N-acetyltransferase